MSMFDWKASEWASIASRRLWLYWAVSIPLTLIILVIWYIWLVQHPPLSNASLRTTHMIQRHDLGRERISRHTQHSSGFARFKEISSRVDKKQDTKHHHFRSVLKMRKKSLNRDQETGSLSIAPPGDESDPNPLRIRPTHRALTGQGPRR